MTLDEYLQRDAVGLAELVWNKEVTPGELLELALARMEEVDPAINAVTDDLRAFAGEETVRGLPEGPFRGVPFLLKDQLDLRGQRTRRGCRLLENYVSDFDSEVVTQFRRAGLVCFGRTNMPELGLNVTTESRMYGPTRNPWNRDYSAGGSSGGSAAAIAAGICPAASATDGGGSIRIPAACCGVFGLKPSRGRVSFGPDRGEGWAGMSAHGVVTRSVRDSALLLDCISSPTEGEPYPAPSSGGPFFRCVEHDPRQLRIALIASPPNDGVVHPACREATESAGQLCAESGHLVSEREFPINGAELKEATSMIIRTQVAAGIDEMARTRPDGVLPDDVERATWAIYEAGRLATGIEYVRAVDTIHRIGRQMAAYMEDYDVILSPVLAEPPIRLGVLDTMAEDVLKTFERLRAYSPFCNLYNATGQPAMSVPLCWSDTNLPIGVQFAGRYGEEATLFHLAGQLERARPWAARYRELWDNWPDENDKPE